MKHNYRRRKPAEFADPDFAEALYGNKSDNHSRQRQVERKTEQLCRQVQRALNLALAESVGEGGLNELFVEGVSPAPHCGHLLVQVLVPAGRSLPDAIAALRQSAPRLRSEVAMAIARKRAPELSFFPAVGNGRSDE